MSIRQLSRLIGIAMIIVVSIATAAPAAADQLHHTTRSEFHPVADAPLKSGFVLNIHANGPNVFAHEVYSLKDAIPNTTFQMRINVHVDDLSCSEPPTVSLVVDEITTNGAGNATGDLIVPPELIDALGLRNVVGADQWDVLLDGEIIYRSDCAPGATD